MAYMKLSARCLALVACFSTHTMAMELSLPQAGADIVGAVQVHHARYEDTFADIGEANDLGYLEMVAANPGVDAWLPGAGTEILLPTQFILPPGPRQGIVINLAEYRLYYYSPDGTSVFTYPLGIGREGWESPVSVTRISAKTPNPAWYPPQSIRAEHAAEGDPLPTVVPPGPDNPLGPYKLNLALPGYLIHGSNKKFGIGMRVSHGCFRMLNNNVLELADMVRVGTSVRIINEPYKFGVSDGKLYLEAHTPLSDDPNAQDTQPQTLAVNRLLEQNQWLQQYNIDWDRVQEVINAHDGIPVQISNDAQSF